MHRTLLGLLVVSLLAGCGDDDDDVATDDTETPTETDTETDTESDSDSETETGTETETSTDGSTGSAGLAGERIDIFPYEDTVLAVVGVEADDVLNVREAPGPREDVVVELDPLADDIEPSGHNRQLDDGSIWAEITAEGVTGWANTAFLAHLGDTDDTTSQLYPDVADRPSAETMLELGDAVAAEVAGSDEPEPDVVVVDGPTVGDLGEITVDVIGFPDDSVLGARLHVFAEPDPSGDGFTVRSVESTTLCRRGVSEGLCV
jgi:hypothetical protein